MMVYGGGASQEATYGVMVVVVMVYRTVFWACQGVVWNVSDDGVY